VSDEATSFGGVKALFRSSGLSPADPA
jgi:hypothetical protein